MDAEAQRCLLESLNSTLQLLYSGHVFTSLPRDVCGDSNASVPTARIDLISGSVGVRRGGGAGQQTRTMRHELP